MHNDIFMFECMSLGVSTVVQAAKAVADPSRVRILAILDHHELTVSELVLVLGQSQPRVSRHLKLLQDAGFLHRKAEGRSAFYRLERSGPVAVILRTVLDGIDAGDPDIAADARRLHTIREARDAQARAYFEQIAGSWDAMRHRHVAEAEIENALVDMLRGRHIRSLLDLGTGTGRVLEIAAPHIEAGIGVDLSRDMLAVARHKLEAEGLYHCDVRHGDLRHLSLPDGSMDMAVLHHVLHFLDDPADALAEAARTLRPGGTLVVVDFATHTEDVLRTDHQHQRLGFDTDEMDLWCRAAGLEDLTARTFTPDLVDDETLTVVFWTATQRPDAPSTHALEVA